MAQQLYLRTKHHTTMWIIFGRDEQCHRCYRPPGSVTWFVIWKSELSREAVRTRCIQNSGGYYSCYPQNPRFESRRGARYLGKSLFVVFTRKYLYADIKVLRQFLYFLYFVDRAFRYKFLLITNLTQFFMYLFIYLISLYVSSITMLVIMRSNCVNTSSGMISLCKWLLVMLVRRELQFPPDQHIEQSRRLIIPDDVLTQFDLMMMSIVMLETYREIK